jgi:hypothetical protein
MSSIADILLEKSSRGEIFVIYQEEPDLELHIPFTTKNGVNTNNTLIIGENFIEKTLISIEKNKIIGIEWFDDTQTDYLNQQKDIVYKKIEMYNNLINNLKYTYNYDKKYVIYDSSRISLSKVPFNIKTIKELTSNEDIEMRKDQFKLAINRSVIKAKEIVDEEAKEYIDANDLSTLEEIKAIKEIIDESVDCIDYTDVKTPEELILKCWPVILTPNPFIVNV